MQNTFHIQSSPPMMVGSLPENNQWTYLPHTSIFGTVDKVNYL